MLTRTNYLVSMIFVRGPVNWLGRSETYPGGNAFAGCIHFLRARMFDISPFDGLFPPPFDGMCHSETSSLPVCSIHIHIGVMCVRSLCGVPEGPIGPDWPGCIRFLSPLGERKTTEDVRRMHCSSCMKLGPVSGESRVYEHDTTLHGIWRKMDEERGAYTLWDSRHERVPRLTLFRETDLNAFKFGHVLEFPPYLSSPPQGKAVATTPQRPYSL